MTVFVWPGRVPCDARVSEVAEPLAVLGAELPVIVLEACRGGYPGLGGGSQEVVTRSYTQQPGTYRYQQCQPHDGAVEDRPEATGQTLQADFLEKPETGPGPREQAHRHHAPRPGDVDGATVADAAAHGKQSRTPPRGRAGGGAARSGSAAARVVGGARGRSQLLGRVGAFTGDERTRGGGVRCPEWINNRRRSQS